MFNDSSSCKPSSKNDHANPLDSKVMKENDDTYQTPIPMIVSMNRGTTNSPNYRNILIKLKKPHSHVDRQNRPTYECRMGNMERGRKINFNSRSELPAAGAINKTLDLEENCENQNILVGFAKMIISFVRSPMVNRIGGKSDSDIITHDVTGSPTNLGVPEISIANAETNTQNNYNKYELANYPHCVVTRDHVGSGVALLEINAVENSREMEQTRSISSAIGIDLGTCYASVAVLQSSNVAVIENSDGKRKIPCCVSFTNVGRLIGVAAEDQEENYINTTISNVKRLMGRICFNPYYLQHYQKAWLPLNLTMSYNRPTIEVEYEGAKKHFLPEEISSMILVEMKEIAEVYLKTNVKDVVITVPANFTDSQRIATRDAGRIAGLNVLEIINDTTAAAITYHSLQVWTEDIKEKNVLIVDLGGGTFDVSVITVTTENIEVKSLGGYTQFGGGDFDRNLVHLFVKDIQSKYQRDILHDKKALAKLRKTLEKAKKILFNLEEVHVNIQSFIDGNDLPVKVTRAMFEEVNSGLLKWCTKAVEACVSNAKMQPNDIDDIVLVGGSSRVPYLQQHLQTYFKKECFKRINPDEAVIRGAAIRAAFLSTKNEEHRAFPLISPVPPKIKNINPYFNIWSYSFDRAQYMHISEIILITNNAHEVITTTTNNQYYIPIYVYTGDGSDIYAHFSIWCMPSRPVATEIIISFTINNDGILSLKANNKHSNQANIFVKKELFDCLEDQVIDMKKNEADAYQAEAKDKSKQKKDAAMESFELCIYNMKRKVKNSTLRSAFEDQGKSAYKWMESNPSATEEEIMNQMEVFRSNCNSLLKER